MRLTPISSQFLSVSFKFYMHRLYRTHKPTFHAFSNTLSMFWRKGTLNASWDVMTMTLLWLFPHIVRNRLWLYDNDPFRFHYSLCHERIQSSSRVGWLLLFKRCNLNRHPTRFYCCSFIKQWNVGKWKTDKIIDRTGVGEGGNEIVRSSTGKVNAAIDRWTTWYEILWPIYV